MLKCKLVTHVSPNSVAESANVQVGDIIEAVDDKRLVEDDSVKSLIEYVLKYKDSVEVTFLRAGKTFTCEVSSARELGVSYAHANANLHREKGLDSSQHIEVSTQDIKIGHASEFIPSETKVSCMLSILAIILAILTGIYTLSTLVTIFKVSGFSIAMFTTAVGGIILAGLIYALLKGCSDALVYIVRIMYLLERDRERKLN